MVREEAAEIRTLAFANGGQLGVNDLVVRRRDIMDALRVTNEM
jgi:hypothetical protein